VTQKFRRMASRAGLSGIRLHDLRHTHASLMLQQGTDINTISTRRCIPVSLSPWTPMLISYPRCRRQLWKSAKRRSQ
ncbi:MAG: hypothetical protein FI724_00950, partial [SAR202 cluster bacterium]|nr:hypothetical protein [SAR202 cluster bacterium]